jgi:ELWxxDGT repeat protein
LSSALCFSHCCIDIGKRFRTVGDVYFFRASFGVLGRQLWRSDGTQLLHNNVSVQGARHAVLGNTMIFAGLGSDADNAQAHGLWRTDGTTAGTVLVSDIYPGAGWSAPAELIAYKNALYFSATGTDGVRTLWRSDGSAAGTAPVRAGTGAPIDPSHMRVVDGQLFFSAGDPAYGRELWRSDGSAAGTVLHQDIAPGAVSSNAQPIAANGTHLFVQAYTPQAGRELFAAPIGALQTPPTPPPPSTTTPVRGARKLHLPVVQRR